MSKKYGMFLVIVSMFLCFWFLATGICLESSSCKMFPIYSYQNEDITEVMLRQNVQNIVPVLSMIKENRIIAKRNDLFTLKKIKPVELLTMMEVENMHDSEGFNFSDIATDSNIDTEITQEVIIEENTIPATEIAETINIDFQPRDLQRIIDIQTLTEYETLVKNFYTIDACALAGSELLDADKLSKMDLRITKEGTGPQILIYHTHSQEGFVDSVAGDDSTTIMGVGAHLAEILENQYGYDVLHHVGKYDVESRDNAYSRALPEVIKILEENPGIEVIIDLHRDAVNDDYKLVMDLDGRPTARFMFFNGVSCTKNTGKISYLENENQAANLAFSFQMKKLAEEYYPGLTRKNYIHGYRYNMHLLPRTTLIELGAQNNTLEEAMNACDPIAHILDMVLNEG